jgi:hypothetical protein
MITKIDDFLDNLLKRRTQEGALLNATSPTNRG